MVGAQSRNFFLSRIHERNPFVGPPELPFPGTTLYNENLSRLNNPEFLKQASGRSQLSTYNTAATQKFLLEAIEKIKDQNSQLLNEMHRLNQRVQQLESRLERP